MSDAELDEELDELELDEDDEDDDDDDELELELLLLLELELDELELLELEDELDEGDGVMIGVEKGGSRTVEKEVRGVRGLVDVSKEVSDEEEEEDEPELELVGGSVNEGVVEGSNGDDADMVVCPRLRRGSKEEKKRSLAKR